MTYESFIETIQQPLPAILLIAVAGLVFSGIFRFIRLPGITGQIALGVILAQLLGHNCIDRIQIISTIALGVMTFTVGTHLNYQKIHNSWRRIVTLASFDIILSYTIPFIALTLFTDLSLISRLLISSLAVATAPGTIIHLIQGKQARGPMVKTLLGVVALNNVATIIIFEICRKIGSTNQESWIDYITGPIGFSLLAILIGTITGLLLSNLTKHIHKDSKLLGYTLLTIVLNIVICQFMKDQISPLLVNLATGIALGNSTYHIKRILHLFEGVNIILFTIFFTLAGTHLDISSLASAGLAGTVFVLARVIGKVGAPFLAARFCSIPGNLRNNLGMSLIPQAGLAVGLVITLGKYDAFTSGPENIAAIVSTIILAAVTVNEIVGPLTASKAFDLANETNQANTRLVDFLHEEYIMVPLKATDKWDAIEQLCSFLAKTHHMKMTREELTAVVMKREREMSTGLGNGVALPHVRIEQAPELMGVIGILDKPLDFEALDGKPVNVIIMVATPKDKVELHLKVCQTVAKIFTTDLTFFDKLVQRKTPAEVYNLLQSKEIRDLNYFIDESS